MDDIHVVTGVGIEERNELIRWYSRLNEIERIDVNKLQTDLLRQKREQIKPLGPSTGAYAALVLALAKRRRTLTAVSRKEHMTPAQAEQVTKMHRDAVMLSQGKGEGRIARLVRLRWYHEIKQHRQDGFSWRQIASLIAKKHKIKVSHNQIRLCYQREEINRHKQED
jgi:hypothetical protein